MKIGLEIPDAERHSVTVAFSDNELKFYKTFLIPLRRGLFVENPRDSDV